MKIIWIIAVALFLLFLFLFWRLTVGYYKKEFGEKMWRVWGTKIFFWQGAVIVSSVCTMGVLYLLKSGNILIF